MCVSNEQNDQNEPAAVRAELATADMKNRIRAVVDAAPPLTEAQRERLAVLLRPWRSYPRGLRS